MSIATTRTLLAYHQAQISGVTKAFDFIPRSIQLAELPCFVTFVGALIYDMDTTGDQMFIDQRLYTMTLFVQLLTDGVEGEAEEACYPFITSVVGYFMDHRGLEAAVGGGSTNLAVFDSKMLGDLGPQQREFPLRSGRYYATLPFQIRVRDLASISDAV